MVTERDFADKGQSGGDRATLRWVDNFPAHFLTPFVIHSFIQKIFTKRYNASSFPGGVVVKNLPVSIGDTRDAGSIPGLGSSRGIGNGNPLQYSCLENSIDRGAWWATVHEVAESQT